LYKFCRFEQMKKIIVSFLLLISSVFAYAQDTSQVKSKKTKRFFVGVNFSSDLCSVFLKDGASSVSNYKVRPKFGYSVGLNFCYIVSKRINIETSIQYSNKGYVTPLTFGDMIDRRRGFVYNTSPIKDLRYISTFHYLDIPLKVNFVFGKKRTRFIAGLGLITNLLFKSTDTFSGQKADGISFKNSSTVTNEYNRVNLSPMISCGLNYKINDKMFFKIEPIFRCGITPTTHFPFKEYLWSAGLNLSWYFL